MAITSHDLNQIQRNRKKQVSIDKIVARIKIYLKAATPGIYNSAPLRRVHTHSLAAITACHLSSCSCLYHVGIQGHAVWAQSPTDVVKGYPCFPRHPLYKSFYHPFHQITPLAYRHYWFRDVPLIRGTTWGSRHQLSEVEIWNRNHGAEMRRGFHCNANRWLCDVI